MNLPEFDLAGRVAIVTGAGKGIGRAIALGFARAGADVVVAARTAADIEDVAAKIRDEGRKTLAIPTDVRKADEVTNLLRKTMDSFNKVDILVNSAGGEPNFGYVLDLSVDSWREGIETSLTSIFICNKIIGEVMVKQKGGNIINLSSGMGFGGFPGGAHHAAAKAGVMNFTKTLSLEWAPHNIRVNCIAPGYVETPLTAEGFKMIPGAREATLKNIPMGRLARPEEMATLAIFLASPASSYITGETIYASGGLITSVPPHWNDNSLREKLSGPRK